MSVDLYSRSLLSHINGLKPHLQACPAFCFGSHFDLIWNLAPFLYLWPRKLILFHKRATRPSLIITSLLNFKLFFLLRLKFDNDVMIKLGRAARLWNGTSLRGHKWRNGDKIEMASKTKRRTSLQMFFLKNRLYVKGDFANTNQHSSTKAWIILFQLNF